MPRVLIFDIETAPNLSWSWGLFTELTTMKMVENEWYMLCWCAKWLGEKKIISSALPDHKGYKKDPTNDKKVLEVLWKLLDEADIVIAHNIKFDKKKSNARFIYHGMKPPSPYKCLDTLMAARGEFNFTSNKLDALGQYLKCGKKVPHSGFDLWRGCMNGCKKSWHTMVKYCKQDVALLEKVYLKLRPYIRNHPNMNVYENKIGCPKCGSESVQSRGYYFTSTGKFQRFRCNDCGGWSKKRKNEMKNITLANAV